MHAILLNLSLNVSPEFLAWYLKWIQNFTKYFMLIKINSLAENWLICILERMADLTRLIYITCVWRISDNDIGWSDEQLELRMVTLKLIFVGIY